MEDSSYKNITLMLFVPVFAYAIKYAFNLLLSHLLEGELYGDFIIGLKSITLFSTLILLGTATNSKRFLNIYMREHDTANQSDYIHWNLNLIARSSIIFVLSLAGLLAGMIVLHVFNVQDIREYHLAIYMLFLSPLAAIYLLIISYIQCNNKVLLYTLCAQTGNYLVYTLSFVIIYYCLKPYFSNGLLWSLSLMVYLILNLIALFLAFFYLPKTTFFHLFKLQNILTKPVKASLSWIQTSKHFIVSDNLFAITCLIDLYSVKFFASGKFATSQYAIIVFITAFIFQLANAISSYLEPKVSLCIDRDKQENLQKLVNKTMLINLLSTTLVAAILIYYSKQILSTFGPTYSTATTEKTMIILAIGYYIGVFSLIPKTLLSMLKHEAWSARLSTTELVLVTVFCIPLTIYYGIIGAAIAVLIAIAVKTIVFLTISYRKTKLKLFWLI